jgi:hypothetical protein
MPPSRAEHSRRNGYETDGSTDERIRGCYEHVPPILRLEFDHVIREPLGELRVQVGGGSIGRRVRAEVGPMSVSPRKFGLPPRALEVPVAWQAAEHPALVPTLNGQLRICDAEHETIELRLTGEYTPPLSPPTSRTPLERSS